VVRQRPEPAPLPGGVSQDERKQLLSPPSEAETQAVAAQLTSLSKEEAAEYGAEIRRLVGKLPAMPRVLLYPVEDEHTRAFARFVSLIVVPPDVYDSAGRIVGPIATTREGWIVSGYLAWTNSGEHVAIRQLTLEPVDGSSSGVTSTVLRAVAREAGAILAKARAQLVHEPEWLAALERFGLETPSSEEKARAHALAEAAATATLKRGRTGYPDDHYRRIALLYLELQAQGVHRGILRKIAELESERLGRPVPRETARDWVSGATKRRFLTPGRPGAAGRREGPNLYKLDREEGTGHG